MNHARLAAALLAALTLGGCPIGNNKFPKPADLSPAWRIDKLRVLAVVADPPEVRPGETATFRALIVDPQGDRGATVWLACPSDGGGIGFGCAIDPAFDFTTATPDELAAAGFIGFEPFLSPTYTAPADLLDGLDARAAAEGAYVTVTVSVLPADVLAELTSGEADPTAALDFSSVQVAYKRLVVSTAVTPNHNPEIVRFTAEGAPLPPGATLVVDAGETYEIGAELAEGAVESYLYKGPDGVWQERVEEPYIHWYTDGGTMQEEITLHPYLQADWVAPDPDAERDEGDPAPPTSGTLWAVVRDRRGGMSWAELPWRLRGAADTAAP
jgi:hypothetical protein